MSYNEGTDTDKKPTLYGCIMCDLEDEKRARNLAPGEKIPAPYITEDERDEALARLYSGEAYREHEASKPELLEEYRAGLIEKEPRYLRRRGNAKT